MFNVVVEQDGNKATVRPEGMLNSRYAPELSTAIAGIPNDVTQLVLDCEKLRYTSSAGLRVILALQTRMDKCGGSFVVTNINSILRETFNDTGFSEFLTIE